MEFIQIEVAVREELGTAHARRIRRAGNVPAVLYGMKRPNLQLSIAEEEMQRFLKTGSHLVELRLGDKTRPAILREIQQDPVSDEILHVDFHRVDHDVEVDDHVHVHFKGRAAGEKEGGVFQTLKETIHVRCRPKLLPEEFLLEIAEMHVGDTLKVSQLEVPAGVTILDDPDDLVAQVAIPKRVAAVEVPAEEAEVEGEGEAEAAPEGEAAPTEGGAPAASE
jgi:large subunit ribosomal protein L25